MLGHCPHLHVDSTKTYSPSIQQKTHLWSLQCKSQKFCMLKSASTHLKAILLHTQESSFTMQKKKQIFGLFGKDTNLTNFKLLVNCGRPTILFFIKECALYCIYEQYIRTYKSSLYLTNTTIRMHIACAFFQKCRQVCL